MSGTIDDLAKRWLKNRTGGLSKVESAVLQSTIDRKTLARDISKTFALQQGLGDRIADNIARFGGSWTFILGFLGFLAVWTIGNAWLLGRESFDPYPFIFLNLVLSMIAALQAPVIMMSQNRQAEHDRIDAAHDYEVNLKAEIEIMALHEKIDELRHQQIISLTDEIARIAAQLQRIEGRLAAPSKPAKPRL